MLAVIFEVIPSDSKWDEYLDIAAGLRAELATIDGFISVERFQSITNPGKVLSLSFWRDEESVRSWRNTALHRAAQEQGRKTIFDHYRLRVAEVCRDYGMTERDQAPEDSKIFHQ